MLEEIDVKKVESSIEVIDLAAKVPEITSDDMYSMFGDHLKNTKLYIKAFEQKLDKLLDPFKTGMKNLKAEFEPKIKKAGDVKKKIESLMSAWNSLKERKAAAEARRLEEEEKARLDKIAEEAKFEEEIFGTKAEQVVAAVETAKEKVYVKPVEIQKKTTGEFSTTTVKRIWDYQITNADKVERKYCAPSAGLLRSAVNAGVRDIPGVRVFQRDSFNTR